MAEPISVLSKEYRSWPVTATEAGVPVDPTDDPVYLAFAADADPPAGDDFVAAEWETIGGAHFARVLIGPGALELAAGAYRVWVKVTDSPEIPVLPIDTLSVTATFAVAGGSYTGDPANVPGDAVRLYLGDTTAPFTLSDSEIAWFLTRADDDALVAALAGARATAARFSRLVDSSVGDIQKSYSQRYKHFAEVADDLAGDVDTATAAAAVPIPWAGGISWSEREANDTNGDLVPPYFFEGMDDRPGTVVTRDGRC